MVLDDLIENCDVMYRGHEVKEALRAQMEVQSKLHLLVEVNFLFSRCPVYFSLGYINFRPF